MTKAKETESQEPQKSAEPDGLCVTLIPRGQNIYDVRGIENRPVLCKCGRPISASLHHVSVPKRLEPCSMVVIKQDE